MGFWVTPEVRVRGLGGLVRTRFQIPSDATLEERRQGKGL